MPHLIRYNIERGEERERRAIRKLAWDLKEYKSMIITKQF